MRTGNLGKNKFISLKVKLKELKIYSLSRSTCFQKRKSKKISALNLIISFYNCNLNGTFSLSGWAFQLSQLISKPVSKQAIFGRVDDSFIELCRELLQKSFGEKIKARKLLSKFRNVYIQDSTCVLLPSALYDCYKGNGSRTGNHSVAKIQVIYNLMKSTFEELKITSFTRNDQAAAFDILQYVKPGDLIVRDLGYFVLNSLVEIMNIGAHFICPLRKDTKLFDPQNNKPIELIKVLKKKRYLKMKVLLGAEHKIAVTLFAVKLDDKTTKYRQRCAAKNRDLRRKINDEKLQLLSWDIFVSSCEELETQTIQDIYKIRWHIEILFKSWKSHLKLEKNIPKKLERRFIPEAIMYLTLLLSILFIMPIYRWALKINSEVSLIKITRFLASVMPKNDWCLSLRQLLDLRPLILYESRDRPNFITKLSLLT